MLNKLKGIVFPSDTQKTKSTQPESDWFGGVNQEEFAQKIFAEYEKGKSYNLSIDLYERVKTNNNLFLGKQWEGVDAPSFDKPVFNIIKRVVNYLISMIVADDFAVSIAPFFPDEMNKQYATILEKEVAKVFERTSFRAVNRDFLRNTAIDGDAYFILRFDPTTEIGQTARGSIDVDVIDSTDVMYGNPYDDAIEKQPFILVMERRNKDSLKNELDVQGISYDPDLLVSDDDNSMEQGTSGIGDQLITVIHKYFRHGETIWYTKITRNLVLEPPRDLGFRRYPISAMVWEKNRWSYHGQSVADGLAPNQYAINRMMAAALATIRNHAFPTILFDESAFNGKPQFSGGKNIAVRQGVEDINKAVTTLRGGEMSTQVMPLVDRFTNMTKELMGASDAALGNINPDNTSAIIAVQRATAAPLDLQIKSYRQAIEGVVRSVVDIMIQNYGMREVWDEEIGQRVLVDFSEMADLAADINVDIGAGAYYSELLQIQTLDNLMGKGLIPDPVEYIRAIPDHMVKNKSGLIKMLQEKQEMEQAMAELQQGQIPDAVEGIDPGMMMPAEMMGGETVAM